MSDGASCVEVEAVRPGSEAAQHAPLSFEEELAALRAQTARRREANESLAATKAPALSHAVSPELDAMRQDAEAILSELDRLIFVQRSASNKAMEELAAAETCLASASGDQGSNDVNLRRAATDARVAADKEAAALAKLEQRASAARAEIARRVMAAVEEAAKTPGTFQAGETEDSP